jgi:hypothetical protein
MNLTSIYVVLLNLYLREKLILEEALSDRGRCYRVPRKQPAYFAKTNRIISEILRH